MYVICRCLSASRCWGCVPCRLWNVPPVQGQCRFPTRSRGPAGHEASRAYTSFPMLCPIAECKGPLTLSLRFTSSSKTFRIFCLFRSGETSATRSPRYFYSNAKGNDVDEQRSRTPAGNALRLYQPSHLFSLL
jgi:hypothetical protein